MPGTEDRWIVEAGISSRKSFVPTATLPLIRYSLDQAALTGGSTVRYHVRAGDRSGVLHNAKNYEIKAHSYRRVIRQEASEMPTVRVGVLTKQDARSIAAILNEDRDTLRSAQPSGSLALEVAYSRGEKMVEENSKKEILCH